MRRRGIIKTKIILYKWENFDNVITYLPQAPPLLIINVINGTKVATGEQKDEIDSSDKFEDCLLRLS